MNNGYAICLKEWILDSEIKNELQLLLIVSNLCAKLGYCYAGNKYFSDLFNIDESVVSRKLKKLADKNYIKIEYKKRGCEIIERKIRLTNLSTDDCQNYQSTIDKKVKENNINNNNINIKEEIYKEEKNVSFAEQTKFEEFWRLYPKQRAGSKSKALQSYIKVLREKRATEEKLLTSVVKYANSIEVSKGYAKGCQAWLNDDRFNNEYEQVEKKGDNYNYWL